MRRGHTRESVQHGNHKQKETHVSRHRVARKTHHRRTVPRAQTLWLPRLDVNWAKPHIGGPAHGAYNIVGTG